MLRIKIDARLPLLLMAVAISPAMAGEMPQEFTYKDGKPAETSVRRYVKSPQPELVSCPVHRHEVQIPPIKNKAFIYASFDTCDMNPLPLADGKPDAVQTIVLGHLDNGKFTEAVRFGIVDDDRASRAKKANYAPGVFDGKIDYYGPFARPRTTYDFKIHLDVKNKRMTVWVSGRGDDLWYPLALNVPISDSAAKINAIRVDLGPRARGVRGLVIREKSWPEGEHIRPHPLAKKDRIVGPDGGFRLQSQRSLWHQADRHVTVARNPNANRGWWLGFPDVVQAGPKLLLCVHNDGAAHGGNGKMWVRRSEDLGKTWSEPLELHPHSINCPRIQKLRDGSFLILADTRHTGIHPVVFYRSTDVGRTWKYLGKLDPPAAGGNDCCVPSHV
ncbi:MAG: exo-alpha-sialidase, partial [Pirellulales bacterium]|nr:exo-alpha-sialidase [Pirellulales bacterium]